MLIEIDIFYSGFYFIMFFLFAVWFSMAVKIVVNVRVDTPHHIGNKEIFQKENIYEFLKLKKENNNEVIDVTF